MYVDGLVRYLDRPMGARYIRTNPDIVGAAWPEFLYVAALPSLSDNAHNDSLPPHPALKPLTLRELDRFQAIWQRGRSRLSVHNLSLLWGWKDLVRLWWTKQDGAVCVVVEDRGGFFMPLPPFGRPLDIAVLKSAWSLLEELNHGSGVSRIEGWEEVPNWVTKAGFLKMLNESEYLYRTDALVALKGSRLRSIRWAIHRSIREVRGVIRPFDPNDADACMALYRRWAIRRQMDLTGNGPGQALIRDGFWFHRRLILESESLGWSGWVFEKEGNILGYTFGAPISSNVFGVFLEITDRSVPGLAQRLFHAFCKEIFAKGYTWVNVMGDGGLAGLQHAKRLYRPTAMPSNWAVTKEGTSVCGLKPQP